MNAVEIEEAVSALAMAPFDRDEFPFQFLAAFGNKDTTIKRLRAGASNTTDVAGAVLQRAHIHLATAAPGEVGAKLKALGDSPKTKVGKVKFILATDGITFEAEDLIEGETATGSFEELADHFGFFLPLAGISTVRQIRDNPFDIRATGRLNKLYLELLKENPEWANEARRHDLNQFMARLIFCFFAEDTGIFWGEQLFTANVEKYSDVTNTNVIIARMFAAMDTKPEERVAKGVTGWVDYFPYVNGGLFGGTKDIPKFSREARTYLLHAGKLNWKQINPDIFGSMIQAVADDGERGELGMHYTSVPNILKVLNPLFLDDVREKLAEAGDNKRKLLALRRRLAAMRVFDPACGSGNFLVIAYIQMREIEAEIIARRGDEKKSWIKLTQFYGIELKDFAAEIARLALLIAEFQSDVRLIGQQEALIDVLPLRNTGLITQGNALRLDWLTICPPVTKTMVEEWDLGGPTGRLALEANGLDGDEVEPETYICGNPPYFGDKKQTPSQKLDVETIFSKATPRWKSLDCISGFFKKGADFIATIKGAMSLVSTNSICQGQQVNVLWPILLKDCEITAAHTGFKWSNLAAKNAGVTVVIVQLASKLSKKPKTIYDANVARSVDFVSPYLTSQRGPLVGNATKPLSGLPAMTNGCAPKDGGNLLLERKSLVPENDTVAAPMIKPFWGTDEIVSGLPRYCLWIEDHELAMAQASVFLTRRFQAVAEMRSSSKKPATRLWSDRPHRFVEIRRSKADKVVALPSVTTETRQFLTPIVLSGDVVISNLAFAMFDPPLWIIALLSSRTHEVWVRTVCGQLETRIRYSNTLGWNTFPVPPLSDTQKADLTTCAQDILLAREAHWPATIADLYDPKTMPENLAAAHDRNDQTLERIYIGRRFKNDTERLEKLFELYTKMTASDAGKAQKAGKIGKKVGRA